MNRRTLLATLGALGVSFPLRVAAQARSPLIAILNTGNEDVTKRNLDAFRDEMLKLGYQEGVNYRVAVRWSNANIQQLPELARDLVRLNPDLAVAYQVIGAQALHRESPSMPIVMAGGSGALQTGLIESLARPGGKVTGLLNLSDELTAKLFELLREIAPRAKRVVALSSGRGVVEAEVRAQSRAAAKALGMTLTEAVAESSSQLSGIAERCAREHCEALVSLPDPALSSFPEAVTALAASMRIPAVYSNTAFSTAGGLVSYSADFVQISRRAAVYVDKILKGARPGDLPIERPTKFELVVNLKTANSLGIKIPQAMLLRADRVIET
jgi:putative ABC transport system substrate-binding protein